MSESYALPKLGHVHLKVTDLERAERFYRDVLELKVTERVGLHFVFLSFGIDHHDIALQRRPGARQAHPHAVGLYHAAFEVADETALRAVAERLRILDIPFALGDHGICRAIYFADPDGNGLEVYVDTRHRRTLWQGIDEPCCAAHFAQPDRPETRNVEPHR